MAPTSPMTFADLIVARTFDVRTASASESNGNATGGGIATMGATTRPIFAGAIAEARYNQHITSSEMSGKFLPMKRRGKTSWLSYARHV